MAEMKGMVDNVKKGRLLAVALLISVSIFVLKVSQTTDAVSVPLVYARALLYAVLSYIGLLWALKFQVGLKGLLFVLPQSALFVFTQVLFIELFFFRSFGRVYEAFLLFILLALMFIGTYVSFLTANVFNVGSIKEIPLLQVGKTASYVLSLLMVYFLTFGLLESPFHPLISLLIIVAFYISIIYMHFRHLSLGKGSFRGKVSLTVLSMIVLLVGAAFVSSSHELIALVPMVAMFAMTGVVMHNEKAQFKKREILEYVILLLLACALNIIYG